MIVTFLNSVAGFLALVAAGLWWWASVARVAPAREGEPGYGDAVAIDTDEKGRRTDIFASASLQTKRNAKAALVAGLAAFFQVAGVVADALTKKP